MTNRIYILLGRAGDVISFLPVLWKENEEGRRCTLMTCKPFSEIMEGVSYADCIIYPGSPSDISGAVEAAKKLSNDVRVAQVAGPESEIKKHCFKKAETESFQKEAWQLSGHLDWWKLNLPLVIDKRDTAREQTAMPDEMFESKPVMLLATGGVSSKFPYASLLRLIVRLRFKGTMWRIIDLRAVKTHRIYDLIGYLERAKILIATDSAILHLARAVPTLPVIALQADYPGLWNGASWRPEWIWSCRYRDFPRRSPSMVEAFDNWFQQETAYNPTLKREGRKLIHVFSAYTGIAREAKQNWRDTYRDEWVHTPVWFGAFGRDSRFGGIGDRVRFPFVKDVIRAGCMRAGEKDVIVLTRRDTCFVFGLNGKHLHPGPFFSHRATKDGENLTHHPAIKDGENLTHHPAIDLFVFTKEWWQTHVGEFPDMILDNGNTWASALKELMLRHGGVEMPFLTYQAKEAK